MGSWNGNQEATDWSVSLVVEAPGDPRSRPRVEEAAAELSSAVCDSGLADAVVSHDDAGLGMRFTVAAESAHGAVDAGVAVWAKFADLAGISSWPVVRADAATYDQLERERRRTVLPPLVGVAEVADMLGVSKPRVTKLASEEKLPRPLVRLASGPVWTAAGIERYQQVRAQRLGLAAEPEEELEEGSAIAAAAYDQSF